MAKRTTGQLSTASQEGSPSVTVYVVNRNYGRFLRQAVDSALSQDYPFVEIVVVDDASDDGNTSDVLSAFESEPRVSLIRQPVLSGLTACCNAAIRASSGEFVMRLDADDYLAPSAVGKLVAALVADPSAVLAFPDYIEVDRRGAVIRRVQRHDFNAFDALSDLPAHGACTMVRRTFLDRMGGYDESINRQDGLDLWLNVRPDERVHRVGEPLFFYRQHGANLTRDERALSQARAKLIAKHVTRRNLTSPRVLAVVPVRGPIADPQSLALQKLGDRSLIDWTVDEALACAGVDRVVVSSPDTLVLDHVAERYGARVGLHIRGLALAGLNVDLAETLGQVLSSELAAGRCYDAVLTLTVESPFHSRIFMQQAIHVMQLFGADAVKAVRHEDETFYRHDGLGLHPIRQNERMRLERDDLYRACGGLQLVKLPSHASADYFAGVRRRPERLGHVLLDQRSAFTIRTALDWEIAQHLLTLAARESDS
jgi:CMP-N-acetylneuraminic acid synthetase/GT2 family glycosyltransferase